MNAIRAMHHYMAGHVMMQRASHYAFVFILFFWEFMRRYEKHTKGEVEILET